MIDHPSPNCGPRRGGAVPDMVVLHYTAMRSMAQARDRLCDPAYEVSAHYLIGRDGAVLQLVPEPLRAWHAGAGYWGGITDINSRSIGIELDNDGRSPFAAPLMNSLEALLEDLLARHAIAPARVIGHSDMAPARKSDPGPKFDWARLARQDLAIALPPGFFWPKISPPEASDADTAPDDGMLRAALTTLGYAPDLPLDLVLTAFRLRFAPHRAGPACAADLAAANHLARHFPVDQTPPGA